MRHDRYIPLKQSFERLVAFGHTGDMQWINQTRAKFRTFDQMLELYDARLKVIAGVDGAEQAYSQKMGYGMSVDALNERNENELKAEDDARIENFKDMYVTIYGKSASKKEIQKRKLMFEQRLSKKEYLNMGLKMAGKATNVDDSLIPRKKDGSAVSFNRGFYSLLAYGFEYINLGDDLLEGGGEEANTSDYIREQAKRLASDDPKERYKAYDVMIRIAKNIDMSIFEKNASEEEMFSDTVYKQTLLQMLSQFKASVTAMTDDGYSLSKDDRNKLMALGDFAETLNIGIGFAQNAYKAEGSELFTDEEFLSISKERLAMIDEAGFNGDQSAVAVSALRNKFISYSNSEYKVGTDLKYLREKSLAKESAGSLTMAMASAEISLKELENKNYEVEVPLMGRPFDEELFAQAIQKVKIRTAKAPFSAGIAKHIAVESLNHYESGMLEVKEIEKYVKKNGIVLTDEQKKVLDEAKLGYKKYYPYYKKYAMLLTSKGFISTVNKGLYLDIDNDSLSPGMSLAEIKKMSGYAETEDQKATMALWKELAQDWLNLLQDDTDVVDGLMKSCYGENADVMHEDFMKGMTSEQRMVYEYRNFQKYEDGINVYLSKRAENENIKITHHRKIAVMASHMALLKGRNAQDTYENYKILGTKNGSLSAGGMRVKARAIEEIFDEIMSWDINEFSFRVSDDQPNSVKDIAEDFHKKYVKANIGMEISEVLSDYKNLASRGDVRDLKYDAEKLKEVEAKTNSMQVIMNIYRGKANVADSPISNTPFGQELLSCETMPELQAKIDAYRGQDLTPGQKEFMSKASEFISYNFIPDYKTFHDNGDASVVLETQRKAVANKYKNKPVIPEPKAVDFSELLNIHTEQAQVILSEDKPAEYMAKFGTEFKEIYSAADRAKKIKNAKSKLYAKDKNKKEILKAEDKVRNTIVDSEGNSDVETVYMHFKDVLEIDLKNIDLSTDEAVVRNAETMEKVKVKYERLVRDRQNYQIIFNEFPIKYKELYKELPKKIGEINMILSYYRVRKMIIEDPYYSTHEDKEIGFVPNKGDSAQRQHLSMLLMLKMEIEAKLGSYVDKKTKKNKSMSKFTIETETQDDFQEIKKDLLGSVGAHEFDKGKPQPFTEKSTHGKRMMESFRKGKAGERGSDDLYYAFCQKDDFKVDGVKIRDTLFRQPYTLANMRPMQGDAMPEEKLNTMIENLKSEDEEKQIAGLKEVYKIAVEQARYIKNKYKGSLMSISPEEAKAHQDEILRDLQGATELGELLVFFKATPTIYENDENFKELEELSQYMSSMTTINFTMMSVKSVDTEFGYNMAGGYGNMMLIRARTIANGLFSPSFFEAMLTNYNSLSFLEDQSDGNINWEGFHG